MRAPACLARPYRRAVSELHLKALHAHFQSLADSRHGGGGATDEASAQPHISKKGFLRALGAEEGSSLFIERVFTCMDGNRDGYLNFLGESAHLARPQRHLTRWTGDSLPWPRRPATPIRATLPALA